jgi:hypothetical protein
MGWVLATLLFLSGPPQEAGGSLLPSHDIDVLAATVVGAEPSSFDLLDLREEQRERGRARSDVETRSIFGIKRHIGIAAGYDNENVHGSVGFYLTVAEWRRWNFGVPSPAIGFGRYGLYDQKRRQVVTNTDYTLIISLASVHYRAGHFKSLDMNWYINVEQIFDIRSNMPGSQIGVSFSRK